MKFTTKRGKVKSSSLKQHRLLHALDLKHTHIDGKPKRHGKYSKRSKEVRKRILKKY